MEVFGENHIHPIESIDNKKGQELKTHDLSFAVSIDAVLHKIKQKRKVMIVDVRSPEEFSKIHIPGAINIPLYSIKTRLFLKSSPLVLVNTGYDYTQLENECVKLRETGFNVSILWGGLNSWKEKNMEFEGDVFAARDLNKVSPQEVYQERGYKERLVISIGADPEEINEDLSQYPDIKHLRQMDQQNLQALLENQNQSPFTSILICDKDEGYEEIATSLKTAGIFNVFYLSSGLNAYKVFLQNLALAGISTEAKVKSINQCSP